MFPTPVRSLTFQYLANALIIAVAAPLSAATTISRFDNLDGSGNQAIPNGYAGLNWDNFSNYDAKNDPHLSSSGYDSTFASPITVAFDELLPGYPVPEI